MSEERAGSAYQVIRYRGVMANGQPCQGMASVDDLCTWVEQRFNRRWRELVVRRSSDAEEVGGICPDGDTGRRTWWAEGTR